MKVIDGNLWLVEASDFIIEGNTVSLLRNLPFPFRADEKKILETTFKYINFFLNMPHPQLGRTGNVCPFIGGSLNKNTLWLSISPETDEDAIKSLMWRFKNLFLSLEPSDSSDSIFKTILVLFPNINTNDPSISEEFVSIQGELKNRFILDGVMVGEFFPTSKTEGIRNKNFRPLQSPIPMLAIRFMVSSDFLFLIANDDHFKVFNMRFDSGDIPSFLENEYREALDKFNQGTS